MYNVFYLQALFEKRLLAENLSSVTVKNYLSDLRFFLGWINADQNSVNLISTKDIEEYKSFLNNSHFPIKTINRRLSTVRKFFTICLEQKLIYTNPTIGLTNVEEKPMSSRFASHQLISQREQDVDNKPDSVIQQYGKSILSVTNNLYKRNTNVVYLALLAISIFFLALSFGLSLFKEGDFF
ncbi:site-specific integrase [Candidatus Roizmanbacteria bacterium]|nr:site-specific integrase [Candidatus Roizmanbacteria bacterium]